MAACVRRAIWTALLLHDGASVPNVQCDSHKSSHTALAFHQRNHSATRAHSDWITPGQADLLQPPRHLHFAATLRHVLQTLRPDVALAGMWRISWPWRPSKPCSGGCRERQGPWGDPLPLKTWPELPGLASGLGPLCALRWAQSLCPTGSGAASLECLVERVGREYGQVLQV